MAKSGLLTREIQSFKDLAVVMELLRRGKEGSAVHIELNNAIAAHAKSFVVAYPELEPKPKAHYAFHLPKQLERDGWVIDSFVGERKHIGIKSFGSDTKNTSDYERTVLFQALAKQAADLEVSDVLRDRLLCPQAAPEFDVYFSGAAVDVARAVSFTGTEIWVGDVVVVEECVLRVACCIHVGGEFILVCDAYERVAQVLLPKPSVPSLLRKGPSLFALGFKAYSACS